MKTQSRLLEDNAPPIEEKEEGGKQRIWEGHQKKLKEQQA